MDEFKLGTYIKKRREELGISQEALCGGLCAVSSLSRIENNQQDPSRLLTMNLLERLGLPKDRFIALWGSKSISTGALIREIKNDMIRYRRASEAVGPQIEEQVREKLIELEALAPPNDRTIQQFILAQRAILGTSGAPYSAEKKMAMQLEALRLTCPKFNLEDFRYGHYSTDEFMLINQIAHTCSEAGQRKRAIDVYRQLLWYVEKNDKELSEYASKFCLVAHNYAINLVLGKYYADAEEAAERGRKTCITSGNYQFLPGFLAIQAECSYFQNRKERSRELYFQAYYTYKAFEDDINCEIMRQEIKEYLDIEISE